MSGPSSDTSEKRRPGTEKRRPGKGWCIYLMALSTAAGLSSLCLSFSEDHRAALVAAALAVLWSALAAGLLAIGFSTRRMRAQTSDRAVRKTLNYLVRELKTARDAEAKDAPTKAELVDRLHSLALKALDKTDPRF